jgi:hypothetical protein
MQDVVSQWYNPETDSKEVMREFAAISKRFRADYEPIRTPVCWHVLYWLDEYGPQSTMELSDRSYGSHSRTDIGAALRGMAKAGYVERLELAPGESVSERRWAPSL